MRASVHPFPARMAPDLALKSLERLTSGTVLDPMTGSGTVARVAKERNLHAIGFDLDPLAVLISKVATTPVDEETMDKSFGSFMNALKSLDGQSLTLDWIDSDPEAVRFVEFWFGQKQRNDLRKISHLLINHDNSEINPDFVDVLKIALSRIIVTKKQAASLAQDTSHSRPHRVTLESEFDVLKGFENSFRAVKKCISQIPKQGSVFIRRGDARNLSILQDDSIDAVITSPPYLNAIDYMRGHRLSLIWLGHSYQDLRQTRSISIGSERKPDLQFNGAHFESMKLAMGDLEPLPKRFHGMIERYVIDLHKMITEVARVLKPNCNATFVMGNSCLKGVYIENSEALARAGELLGLGIASKFERELPSGSRYLPTPEAGALSKRMRKEVILTFTKK
jgi:tRNA G10  N-methylase Trm11